MTVSTFYPNAHGAGGATSCDGALKYFIDDYTGSTWATMVNATASTNITTNPAEVAFTDSYQSRSGDDTDKYKLLFRSFMLYDTSGLPDGDVISAATISLTGYNPADGFEDSSTVCVTNPASNTEITAADWETGSGEISRTHQSNDIRINAMTTDGTTATVFTLNAAGIASINKTGITKFGTSLLADIDDETPTWGNNLHQQINWYSADEAEAGDERPVLTVTHAPPPFIPKAIMF